MKKIGLLLLLCLAVAAAAQQADSTPADQSTPEGTVSTSVSFPVERVQTPTTSDLYCAGFVNKQVLPNSNFVLGGLHSPNTTKFADNDLIYLAGRGYQAGQQYTIVRELRDANRYEIFAGQHAMLAAMGQPYAELARVRIIDTRSKSAIAHVEFSCEPVDPGDIAIPFAEKQPVVFHPPLRFDRFAPSNGKTSGRIVLGKDFDSELGTGKKVYINVGTNQGIKVGDYFRAVRSYTADLNDPVDTLSFKASTVEDTQNREPNIEPRMLTKSGKGPTIRVADYPRRAVGEIVVIGTTPTTATGMIVFALEDLHLGDGVELDQQQ
ncbi:MAG: hypothetical protein DMG88_08130 [Acidobacteria bacterium]|nr:MAG: hypothetical protein DMG88_08130 [Acidobacteriota bacterium]